jgi:hypothetical protein
MTTPESILPLLNPIAGGGPALTNENQINCPILLRILAHLPSCHFPLDGLIGLILKCRQSLPLLNTRNVAIP